jgi:hypothetical protein
MTKNALAFVLANLLENVCARNDQVSCLRSKFHSLTLPTVSLSEYLDRIVKYSACSVESLILSLIYIDRVITQSSSFVVNFYSIHRVILTSVRLASKFHDDAHFNNTYYARIGGISIKEMNALEAELYSMLSYDLLVPKETYDLYYQQVFKDTNMVIPALHTTTVVPAQDHATVVMPAFDTVIILDFFQKKVPDRISAQRESRFACAQPQKKKIKLNPNAKNFVSQRV